MHLTITCMKWKCSQYKLQLSKLIYTLHTYTALRRYRESLIIQVWYFSCKNNLIQNSWHLIWLNSKCYSKLSTLAVTVRPTDCNVDFFKVPRGKSLLELWATTFLPNWQLPLIFVRFISNFLFMCSNDMASAHVISKQIRQRLRVAFSQEEKWYPTILRVICL